MIRRISSGGAFEEKIGYCRAVVAGGLVHVAGCVAPGKDIPADAAGQCALILPVIRTALAEAGSDFTRIVRVTYYLPDHRDFPECWPILREAFGANPPAAAMLECGLIEPKYRIEIEVTALAPEAGS